MITILIVAIVATIIVGILCKKYEIEFGVEGTVFMLIIGAVIGLLISISLPSPTIDEARKLEEDLLIIKEAPNGNKIYYVLRDNDYEEFYIDKYKDDDIGEPYIIEYRERLIHTKWSIANNTIWKYTYIYYY